MLVMMNPIGLHDEVRMSSGKTAVRESLDD